MPPTHSAQVSLPRVAITFCTQCRWMLRAAYFAQELLSTFSTQIGEVALVPATGGVFQVELTYEASSGNAVEAVDASEHVDRDDEDGTKSRGQGVRVAQVMLWDRKAEGGFPETKVLKQRLRDHIDPRRDLGHSDKGGKKKIETASEEVAKKEEQKGEVVVKDGQRDVREVKRNADGSICEDCA